MSGAREVFTFPVPAATAAVIDDRVRPIVDFEARRLNAHTPAIDVLRRVAS